MELELGKLSRNNFKSTAYPPCLLILLGPPVMDPVPVGKKRENESFAWHRVDSDRLIAKLSIGRGRSRSRSRRPMRMMSEQSLALRSLPGNDGAIIVRSGDRRSLIWSRWRSSARLRLWLRSRFRLWLVTFAFPVYVARRDVGRARWAYKVARLWVPTLAKHFQVSFRTFFRFFGFFCCFFGKVSCSPTECDGDWRRHVFFLFFRIVFVNFLTRLFVIYLRVCVCACVCCFFLLVW